MLSIGPGSVCDVCLEHFGRGDKAPCSILCGHVFCFGCIDQLRESRQHPSHREVDMGAPCPLCRTHFDRRSLVKLHIDVENTRGQQGGSPPRATCLTPADAEARRIQEAFASVANEGTTEPRLRQLIGEATTFLSAQPREQFRDLRVCHRLIAYLCDIKAKLRDERTVYEKELAKVKDEKVELEQKAEAAATKRKDEMDTALAVEMSLREHCARSHKAYEDMVGHYNFVVSEWTKLSEEIARLRALETSLLERDHCNQRTDVTFTPEVMSDHSAYLTSYHDYQMKLNGAALTNPASFMISPLPEFTSAGLPPTFMNAFPLPDIEEEYKKKPKAKHRAQPSSFGCTSPEHPVSCPCVEVPRFPDPSEIAQSTTPYTSHGRNASLINIPAAFDGTMDPAPSGVMSETLPGDRDTGRSVSRASRHSSRSRPSSLAPTQPASTQPASTQPASTQPASPSRRPTSSVKIQSRIPTPHDESMPSTSNAPITMSTPQIQSWTNNRLHDLLHDTTSPGTSSSLPNLPSHFISSIRESRHLREKDRSRSPGRRSSYNAPPPQVQQDRAAQPIEASSSSSSEPAPIRVNQPIAYDPANAPVSTASTAAIAHEKAKRERQRAEQEARRAERREREQESRRRTESERTRASQASSSSTVPTVKTSQREAAPTYTSTSTSSAYASQRSSGYGSRSGPSALRDTFSADKHSSKTMPALGMARS
ncbi:hypothetical protein Hypma_006088 [Hypsizygus marmoreus]|uniref:RING-type domain-containing protein n=1 Tax=Hypsizygus marmoreus TaxID=39966 RepID=A0A369K1K0_HYPMA|nr:hypothetical protein Hypma_006088 [Hypsizygus marmoreus]